jgi:hypothetical protein
MSFVDIEGELNLLHERVLFRRLVLR